MICFIRILVDTNTHDTNRRQAPIHALSESADRRLSVSALHSLHEHASKCPTHSVKYEAPKHCCNQS